MKSILSLLLIVLSSSLHAALVLKAGNFGDDNYLSGLKIKKPAGDIINASFITNPKSGTFLKGQDHIFNLIVAQVYVYLAHMNL